MCGSYKVNQRCCWDRKQGFDRIFGSDHLKESTRYSFRAVSPLVDVVGITHLNKRKGCRCKILKTFEASGCVEIRQPANTTSALRFLLCRRRRANQECLRFHTADKKAPQGGAEELSTLQTQRQDKNVSALVASIVKLQQEKQQLQKEKDELLARLSATNGGNGRNQQSPAFLGNDAVMLHLGLLVSFSPGCHQKYDEGRAGAHRLPRRLAPLQQQLLLHLAEHQGLAREPVLLPEQRRPPGHHPHGRGAGTAAAGSPGHRRGKPPLTNLLLLLPPDVSVESSPQRPLERLLVRHHRRAHRGPVEVGGRDAAGRRVGKTTLPPPPPDRLSASLSPRGSSSRCSILFSLCHLTASTKR